MDPGQALEALAALHDKLDVFTERVRGRYPAALSCGPGCHDCCQPGLSVTAVEAESVAAWLEEQDDVVLARLERALSERRADRCAALDESGACSIYPVRPVVCRSHGLALRLREGEPVVSSEKRRLPLLDACPKNFVQHDLTALEPDCILDQLTLSTTLGAIDAAFCDSAGMARGSRYAIDSLLESTTHARGA